MNNEKFLIENSDLELARDICKEITDAETRNRAVANALAADIAKKYFTEVEIDTETGIHNIAQVLKNIDISDIYVKGAYIDVRLYFNDNELCIPKQTYDAGIQPIAYMFIKVNEELSGGMVGGFVTPSSIDTSCSHNGYYKVNESDLVSFYDIEPLIITNYDEGLSNDFEERIFNYLDGTLEDTSAFYQALINSEECRICLKDAAYVQNVFNFVSRNDNSQTELQQEDVPVDNAELTDISDDSNMLIPSDETSFELTFDESLDNSLDSSLNETLDIIDNSGTELLEEFDNSLTDTIQEAQSNELEVTASDTYDFEDTLDNTQNNTEENDLSDFQDNITLDTFSDDISIVSDDNFEFAANDITEEFATPEIDTQIADEESVISDTTGEIVDSSIAETIPFLADEDSNISESSLEENYTEEITTESTNNINEINLDFETEDETAVETKNQFETNTTPSINEIETTDDNAGLEDLLENDKSVFDEVQTQQENAVDNPEINDLFENKDINNNEETINANTSLQTKRSGSKFLPVVGTLVLLAGIGYYCYTNFFNQDEQPSDKRDLVPVDTTIPTKASAQDAMPIESVEAQNPKPKTEEGNAISIPAIEQNLDASVMVTNLSVSWEVPSGYVANNMAKRYFTKMGKIIQLNLKTELMLFNKQPITNKIMVELEFNKTSNTFDVKGIVASSGEQTIDDLILQTVKNVLNTNLKMNTSAFGNIAGNPILIIRL